MKPFTRDIRRLVTIRSADPALPDAEFVVTCGAEGVAVRRRGAGKATGKRLGWRSLVGLALIHQGKDIS